MLSPFFKYLVLSLRFGHSNTGAQAHHPIEVPKFNSYTNKLGYTICAMHIAHYIKKLYTWTFMDDILYNIFNLSTHWHIFFHIGHMCQAIYKMYWFNAAGIYYELFYLLFSNPKSKMPGRLEVVLHVCMKFVKVSNTNAHMAKSRYLFRLIYRNKYISTISFELLRFEFPIYKWHWFTSFKLVEYLLWDVYLQIN